MTTVGRAGARIPLWYRLARRLAQLAFLALFIYLFGRARYGASQSLGDIFFRLDPLLFLITSIALRTMLAAGLVSLIVLVGTLLFGRFFCGFVCPLGTTIDLFDLLLRRRPKPAGRLKQTKYLILTLLLVAALLGVSFAGFFDPLVILGRSLVLVFYPAGTYLAGLVAGTRPAVFTETFIALCSLAVILGLGLAAPRFWCHNLCPLGGLLGIASKVSLFKFSFTDKCRQCGICADVCPTGAIGEVRSANGEARTEIDGGECIGCLACKYRCPHHAVSYRVCLRPTPFDIGRRETIVALGSGLVLAPLARSLIHERLAARLIRPPGSLPEKEFLSACIRCGRCMKACPTNALQPCILESGVSGLWTPHVVPRIGGCEKNCNACGQVCPTGAIRNLVLEEKSYARLGTAVVDRSRCLAWEQDRACLVCDEACPYNAIEARKGPLTALCPVVDERICVGCGICESRCPIEGPAAIQVFSLGQERRRFGGYKTEEKARLRACGEEPAEDIPSGFIQE